MSLPQTFSGLPLSSEEAIKEVRKYPTYQDYLNVIGVPISHAGVYEAFLQSRFWRECKQKVMARDHNECRNCQSQKHLEVHHLSYKHHGDEFNHLDDLVTLCHVCHALCHGHEPTKRGGGLEHISKGSGRHLSRIAVARGMPFLPKDIVQNGGYTAEQIREMLS